MNSIEYGYPNRLSLANIPQPFAILGLLRLPAALWLSYVHAYHYLEYLDILLSDFDGSDEEKDSPNLSSSSRIYLRPCLSPIGLAARTLFLVPLVALGGYTTHWLIITQVDSGRESVTTAYFAHLAFSPLFLGSQCSFSSSVS